MKMLIRIFCFSLVFATATTFGFAQAVEGGSGPSLNERSQNPIASLISVPIEVDFDFNAGTFDNTQTVFVSKPVYPTKLSNDWNLITRPIIPFVDKPRLFTGDTSEFGLADIQTQFYLVPEDTASTPLGILTWGVGPVFQFPTATEKTLGTGKWAVGPTMVMFFGNPPLSYGFLLNNIWSVAGKDNRPDG